MTLELKEGQEPYKLEEEKPVRSGVSEYEALRYFFQDLGYTPLYITVSDPAPERPPISS